MHRIGTLYENLIESGMSRVGPERQSRLMVGMLLVLDGMLDGAAIDSDFLQTLVNSS